MSIEFRCTTCDRLLRVPDDTAGKTAKCPVCNALLKVPMPPPAAPEPTAPYPAAPNPTAPNPTAPSSGLPPIPPAPGGIERPWNAAEQANPFASPGAGAIPQENVGSDPTRQGPPWEQLGPSPGSYFETWKLVLGDPTRAFATMRRTGGFMRPTYYAVIVGWIAAVISNMTTLAVPGLGFGRFAGAGGDSAMEAILAMIFAPLILCAILHIRSLIIHVMLMLLGGANCPYETTFRVLAYTSGTTAPLIIIPFVGSLAAAVIEIVYIIMGLKEAHEISGGKASAAVLLPALICCIGVIMLVGFAMIGLRSMN